jgi:apolipoprotein N-acyltransferase
MASLGSVSLVTLWLGLVNVLIWRALAGRARLRAACGATLVLLLPWVWGMRVLEAAPKPGRFAATVALVQGNIPGEMKWSGQHQKEILATFLDLSARAAAAVPAPAVILWPETATGSYLRQQIGQVMAVTSLASRTGVPIFAGFPDAAYAPGERTAYRNAAGLFAPDGTPGPVYAKRHLVPFGERMPFQWLIPSLGRLELGQAEWTPGREPVLFPSAAGPFTCLICFESIFPNLAREDVRQGARWIANITNDEWFGNSSALYQHAAMAPFRAVENHVPLARCANTGVTLLADANGRVTARLAVWKPDVLVGALSPAGAPTLYTRVGDWPGMLALAAVAVLALLGARRALTARARAS